MKIYINKTKAPSKEIFTLSQDTILVFTCIISANGAEIIQTELFAVRLAAQQIQWNSLF